MLSAWRLGCRERPKKQPGCVPEGGISPASIRVRSTLCRPLEAVTEGVYTLLPGPQELRGPASSEGVLQNVTDCVRTG